LRGVRSDGQVAPLWRDPYIGPGLPSILEDFMQPTAL
jgi:hypothetical protein